MLLHFQDVQCTSASVVATKPTTGVIAVKERSTKHKQEKPLPRPFHLPENFVSFVDEALKNKVLIGRARTKFITTIAASIFHFKSYPTPEEYDYVAHLVIKTWPFLRTRNGNVRS